MEQLLIGNLADNKLLDTIISLTLIYVLLSLLTGLITEVFNHWSKARNIMLRESIYKMLDDRQNVNFGHLMYQHPLVERMRKNADSLPAYISAETFASTLIDLVRNYKVGYLFNETEEGVDVSDQVHASNDPFQQFIDSVNSLNNSSTKQLLLSFIARSNNIKTLQTLLESWFNDYQDRATGWFKESLKQKTRLAALIVTLILNVDSLHLFQIIYNDDELRSTLVKNAESMAEHYKGEKMSNEEISAIVDSVFKSELRNSGDSLKIENIRNTTVFVDSILGKRDSILAAKFNKSIELTAKINSMRLPVGWSEENRIRIKESLCSSLWYPLGLFITWYALLFGAPFWFEVLVKFINIRRTGTKPEESATKKKK